MKETLLFLKRFLKRKGGVGSVVPSSPFLARKMAQMVPFQRASLIVELGGGTGAVTAALVKRKKKETRLLIFEPDDTFFPLLKKKFEHEASVTVVKESAEYLEKVLKDLKLPRPDSVVSSLPFASIGKKVSAKILKIISQALSEKGVFVLYQYTPLVIPLIMKHFGIKKMALVPFNVPPALVLSCFVRLKPGK